MSTLSSPIPFLDLKSQYATIRDEIHTAIQRVIEECALRLVLLSRRLRLCLPATTRCGTVSSEFWHQRITSGTHCLWCGPGREQATCKRYS